MSHGSSCLSQTSEKPQRCSLELQSCTQPNKAKRLSDIDRTRIYTYSRFIHISTKHHNTTPLFFTHTLTRRSLSAHVSENKRGQCVCLGASCLRRHVCSSGFQIDKRMSPVCGQLLVTHHELQIVDDYMTDVIDIDCMLHCVYDSPGEKKRQ